MLERTKPLVFGLLAACSAPAPVASPGVNPPTGSGAATQPKDVAMSDTRGNIYPAADLQVWLDAHWSDPATLNRVHVRLPVYVTLTANKMYVASAKVGVEADALEIKIDDRTLNIPIAGKFSYFFGEGADRGMLWLQGLWRGGPEKKFQVTKVEGAIADTDRAAATTASLVE